MLPTVVAYALAFIATTPGSSTGLPVKRVRVHLIQRCLATRPCLPNDIVTRLKNETDRIWSFLDVSIVWRDSARAVPTVDGPAWDRYTAPNVSLELIGSDVMSGRVAVPAARSAAKEQGDDQARATTGHNGSPGLIVMLEEGAYPKWAAEHGSLLAGVHQPDDPCGEGLAHLWVRHIQQHVAAVHRDGHPFMSLPKALGDILLARALGRALAHEIGHYLLGTADHTPHGLMRASFAPQDLLAAAVPPLYGLSPQQRASLASCRSVGESDRTAAGEAAMAPHR
jgi:hypothetical protein